MKDKDGRVIRKGTRFSWMGRTYKVCKYNGHGFYFEDEKTGKKASLKVKPRTLAQMERVR
jgi:hypothetical protein